MSVMADENLSLSAELLLLAIDPGLGGLVPHNRGRFRRALARTRASDTGARQWRWRAQREALQELERAGLLQPRGAFGGRVQLADRRRAVTRFNRLRKCLDEDNLSEPRDRELALLLAWTGVLQHRLSRDERRIAARRIRKLARTVELDGKFQSPLSGTQGEPDWVTAVGWGAYDIQRDLLKDAVADLASGDVPGFDAVGLSGAGSESFAGAEGGATDSR